MKKLKVVWNPRIEDDLYSFIVCGVLTQKEANKILNQFKNEQI